MDAGAVWDWISRAADVAGLFTLPTVVIAWFNIRRIRQIVFLKRADTTVRELRSLAGDLSRVINDGNVVEARIKARQCVELVSEARSFAPAPLKKTIERLKRLEQRLVRASAEPPDEGSSRANELLWTMNEEIQVVVGQVSRMIKDWRAGGVA